MTYYSMAKSMIKKEENLRLAQLLKELQLDDMRLRAILPDDEPLMIVAIKVNNPEALGMLFAKISYESISYQNKTLIQYAVRVMNAEAIRVIMTNIAEQSKHIIHQQAVAELNKMLTESIRKSEVLSNVVPIFEMLIASTNSREEQRRLERLKLEYICNKLNDELAIKRNAPSWKSKLKDELNGFLAGTAMLMLNNKVSSYELFTMEDDNKVFITRKTRIANHFLVPCHVAENQLTIFYNALCHDMTPVSLESKKEKITQHKTTYRIGLQQDLEDNITKLQHYMGGTGSCIARDEARELLRTIVKDYRNTKGFKQDTSNFDRSLKKLLGKDFEKLKARSWGWSEFIKIVKWTIKKLCCTKKPILSKKHQMWTTLISKQKVENGQDRKGHLHVV